MMDDVEKIFTECFSKGDHKLGMACLRQTKQTSSHTVTFFLGESIYPNWDTQSCSFLKAKTIENYLWGEAMRHWIFIKNHYDTCAFWYTIGQLKNLLKSALPELGLYKFLHRRKQYQHMLRPATMGIFTILLYRLVFFQISTRRISCRIRQISTSKIFHLQKVDMMNMHLINS